MNKKRKWPDAILAFEGIDGFPDIKELRQDLIESTNDEEDAYDENHLDLSMFLACNGGGSIYKVSDGVYAYEKNQKGDNKFPKLHVRKIKEKQSKRVQEAINRFSCFVHDQYNTKFTFRTPSSYLELKILIDYEINELNKGCESVIYTDEEIKQALQSISPVINTNTSNTLYDDLVTANLLAKKHKKLYKEAYIDLHGEDEKDLSFNTGEDIEIDLDTNSSDLHDDFNLQDQIEKSQKIFKNYLEEADRNLLVPALYQFKESYAKEAVRLYNLKYNLKKSNYIEYSIDREIFKFVDNYILPQLNQKIQDILHKKIDCD